ncbi:Bardet-Biedl syndrome 2 protein-like [Diabrotica virgifera virgifera]|uniref:Bardet-Biedl syndrome 2 protein homolog n=1 Tax=Diabrotica virgifera virgifera TaxID=50390 RepID=A0ABM5KC63_DIAVI|nr:Bardet-Biedl syndrome 2 protein-like [Diabrotica virgifera virgifera]
MDKIVRPVFTLELNYKIVPGLVTIGKYDGTHPCITAATTTDKVLIHSPHRRNNSTTGRVFWSESNKEIANLNINQTITCLTVGVILPDDEKDILLIGTSTHILAYHVHDNKDVLYKECPDGVKSIAVGSFKDIKNVIMVGGNSSVHGYNNQGTEIFWTAVGDIATSLIFMDYNQDGQNELIVSSEDFNIRIFDKDRMLAEHVETEVVTNLLALPENRFAYSVSNGTVGVYEQEVRLWRVKSKHFAISLHYYDLLGQGTPQLVTGWSNGKVDFRSIKTGEVLFKDTMSSGVSGVVEGDYRSIGKNDLICISSEGEVKGYTTTKVLTTNKGSESDQNLIRELLAQKQSLLMELKHYDVNTKYNENIFYETESYENSGVIPANTRLELAISTNSTDPKPHVELYLCTNNSTIIRATIIFAEGIFSGETHVIHPPVSKLKSQLLVPLFLPKDSPVDIHVKVLIGYPNSCQFHVYEITRQLPRFSMYSLKEPGRNSRSDSYVEFKINERLQRICMWINQNFLLPNDIEFDSGPNLTLSLKCLRNDTDLDLVFEISGKITIYTSNISLAADIIQSIAAYLNIGNLESSASFPQEEEKVSTLMGKLQDIQNARLRLETDVADRTSQIRALIVQADDCRINNLNALPDQYKELMTINAELINGYNIRLQNYNEGVETMKTLNSIIQKASRLRVGSKSSNMINFCRTCLNNNSAEGLLKVIKTGEM